MRWGRRLLADYCKKMQSETPGYIARLILDDMGRRATGDALQTWRDASLKMQRQHNQDAMNHLFPPQWKRLQTPAESIAMTQRMLDHRPEDALKNGETP